MKRRRVITCCCVILAGAHLTACGASKKTETVAAAGTDAISVQQLAHWSTISERVAHRRAAEARTHALDFLIVSAWVRAEAKRRNVSVSSQEVAQRVQTEAETSIGGQAEFDAALSRSGETPDDARSQLETRILLERIERSVTAHATVPSAAVTNYYRRHRGLFVTPERRVFLIDTRLDQRQAARDHAEALAGSFPSRAMYETLGRNQINDGGPRRRRIEHAIFSAHVGVPIGPFHNEPVEYYSVLEVTKVVPARTQPLARVRAQIERTLKVAAERQALAKFRRTWQVPWQEATHCRRPIAALACDGSGQLPLALRL